MASTLDVDAARKAFPALQASHQVYFDNAGGSQVLGTVSTAIKHYLEETNVQLGASYDVAKQSTAIYDQGLMAAASFINADPDEVGTLALPNLVYCRLADRGSPRSLYNAALLQPISGLGPST